MIFIVDHRIDKNSIKKLEKYGTVILSDKAEVGWQMEGHPDLQIHRADDTLFVYKGASDRLIHELEDNTDLKITLSDKDLKKGYPDDSILNAVTTESFFIHDLRITDKGLKDAILESHRSRKIINIRQGYTRCTTLPISDEVFLTSDRKIHESILKNGGSSYHIDTDEIILPGYDRGFIGGTSGTFIEDGVTNIVTIGNLSKLSGFNDIKVYLEKSLINPVFISLSDEMPHDKGSIVII